MSLRIVSREIYLIPRDAVTAAHFVQLYNNMKRWMCWVFQVCRWFFRASLWSGKFRRDVTHLPVYGRRSTQHRMSA